MHTPWSFNSYANMQIRGQCSRTVLTNPTDTFMMLVEVWICTSFGSPSKRTQPMNIWRFIRGLVAGVAIVGQTQNPGWSNLGLGRKNCRTINWLAASHPALACRSQQGKRMQTQDCGVRRYIGYRQDLSARQLVSFTPYQQRKSIVWAVSQESSLDVGSNKKWEYLAELSSFVCSSFMSSEENNYLILKLLKWSMSKRLW